MTVYSRIRNILIGIVMIFLCVIMILLPDIGYLIVLALLSTSLLIMGIKYVIYYCTMARYMVGGIDIFYKSIILLDLGIFVFFIADIPRQIAMFYLIGINAFQGVLDILHAIDEKKIEKKSWLLNFILGGFKILLSMSGLFFINSIEILVIIYCIGLFQSAIEKIVSAFKKTAIIYIE